MRRRQKRAVMERSCRLLLLFPPLHLLAILAALALTDAFTTDSKPACPLSQFRCANGKCIPVTWTCDEADDCSDNSDETAEQCKGTQECGKNDFKCANGRCIPSIWHCDGERDCQDNSDEDPNVCRTKNCTTEQFTCRSGNGECVALAWMCDDNPDCSDGSDEAECNETCRSDEFTCENKHCI